MDPDCRPKTSDICKEELFKSEIDVHFIKDGKYFMTYTPPTNKFRKRITNITNVDFEEETKDPPI